MSVVNVGTEYNTGDTDVTDHDISLPASLVTGNTILVIMTLDGQGGGTSTDLTEILDVPHSSVSTQIWAGYRTITGTEGSTVRVTTAAEHATGFAIQLENVDDSTFSFTSAESSSSSTNYDPPSHTPSGGAIERLWFAIAGVNGGITPPFSQWALPDTQYSAATGGSGAAGGGWSTDILSDASVNPQTFIGDISQGWVAATMSVETQAASAPVPSRVMPKPARWAVNAAGVAPSWRWAWRELGAAYSFGGSYPSEPGYMPHAGAVSVVDTTNVIPKITSYGLALADAETGTGTSNLEWDTADPFWTKTYSSRTWMLLVTIDSKDASGQTVFNEGGATAGIGLEYRVTPETFRIICGTTVSNNVDVDPQTYSYGVGETVPVVMVYEEGVVSLYTSGLFEGSQTISGSPLDMPAHADSPGLFGVESGGSKKGSFTAHSAWTIHVMYVWDRALSEGEIFALARDPFGPIRPAGTLIVSLVEQGTLHSGAGVANSSLQMVGAGTLTLILLYATADGTINSVVNEVDTTVNLYASVDDSPSSPTDTDWINNTAGTGSVFLDLTNMPSDFGTMDTLKLTVRWRGQTYIGNKSIYAQIFQSNETTSMSDEVLVATATGDSSFANTTQVTFTGLDTSSGKSVWDGARIRLRWA